MLSALRRSPDRSRRPVPTWVAPAPRSEVRGHRPQDAELGRAARRFGVLVGQIRPRIPPPTGRRPFPPPRATRPPAHNPVPLRSPATGPVDYQPCSNHRKTPVSSRAKPWPEHSRGPEVGSLIRCHPVRGLRAARRESPHRSRSQVHPSPASLLAGHPSAIRIVRTLSNYVRPFANAGPWPRCRAPSSALETDERVDAISACRDSTLPGGLRTTPAPRPVNLA